MDPAGPFWTLFRRPPKTLLEDWDPELDAPIRGPLFPPLLFRTLLILFGLSAMLTGDWIGLLLLNSEGVILSIGPLNALRVTAVLMAGIGGAPAPPLIHH